jgi:Asp-tRNA(Asn)/Glu-tRNA(Gln) amidotransferase B subunit
LKNVELSNINTIISLEKKLENEKTEKIELFENLDEVQKEYKDMYFR